MNGTIWVIEIENNQKENVQCDVVGVAQDGSLLCFETSPNPGLPPVAIKGYAPGVWQKFYRSSLRSN